MSLVLTVQGGNCTAGRSASKQLSGCSLLLPNKHMEKEFYRGEFSQNQRFFRSIKNPWGHHEDKTKDRIVVFYPSYPCRISMTLSLYS